jgi:hypothetical protein
MVCVYSEIALGEATVYRILAAARKQADQA